MGTIHIETVLYAGTQTVIDLPEGVNFEDITEHYIKWDVFHYEYKGEWFEIPMNSSVDDIIDWKRPTSSTIYGMDEPGGKPDYDNVLAENG